MSVRERPILMSAPMVVACMREVNLKSQTRRIMKVQPEEGGYVRPNGDNWNVCLSSDHYKDIQNIAWRIQGTHHVSHILKCPYGKVGDKLWVRETWKMNTPPSGALYRADPAVSRLSEGKWKPSIFMPRWASRITLEITELRVERLQDISDEDCIAEGIGTLEMTAEECSNYNVAEGAWPPRTQYRWLWESINRSGSWDLNPWVFVIAFRRL